jgi:phosphoribosyl-ATP pyrophosphohydrolase
MTTQDSLLELARVLDARRSGDPEKSYVARLMAHGPDAFLKKIGEEATEVVLACKDEAASSSADTKQKIVNETADLWFHSMVALAWHGLSPADVIAELERRVGISGLEEKAARKAKEREQAAQTPREHDRAD